MTDRPAFIRDDHLDYLDQLRESGTRNMFGVSADLQREFGLTRHEAVKTLSYWMNSKLEEE